MLRLKLNTGVVALSLQGRKKGMSEVGLPSAVPTDRSVILLGQGDLPQDACREEFSNQDYAPITPCWGSLQHLPTEMHAGVGWGGRTTDAELDTEDPVGFQTNSQGDSRHSKCQPSPPENPPHVK